MKKEQCIARGVGGSQVHLHGSAAGAVEEKIGILGGSTGGVATAAIHHDDLGGLLSAQAAQCLSEAALFVQGWYDNGDRHGTRAIVRGC